MKFLYHIFILFYFLFKFMVPIALKLEHHETRMRGTEKSIEVWKFYPCRFEFIQYIILFLFCPFCFPVFIFVLHYKVMVEFVRVVLEGKGEGWGSHLGPSRLLRLGQSYSWCRQQGYKAKIQKSEVIIFNRYVKKIWRSKTIFSCDEKFMFK